MTDIKKASNLIEKALKDNGITKAAWSTGMSETSEFNAENEGFNLYRTLYDVHYSLSVYVDGRKGSVAGNDLSEEALENAVKEAAASAAAAPVDEAHDIAPFAGRETFIHGAVSCDEEALFSRTKELCDTIRGEYPKLLLGSTIGKHVYEHSLYRNTNGTEFETKEGSYSLMAEFAGNDNGRTTGIDGAGIETNDLSSPVIDKGSFRQHLQSAVAQLDQTELKGKFTGPVIFSPDCTAQMMYFVRSCFLSGAVVLDGTGIWNDKIGQQVADPAVTLRIVPADSRVAGVCDYTEEGFRARELPLIENGILKNQIIDLYTANKTGREPSRCGGAMIMEAGKTPVAELIRGIERGLLVGAFSGGEPGANGELSGVAKSAFLIENGQVTGAVSETMISTNIANMLMNVRGISSETCEDGASVLPYLAVNGVTISGK